MTRDDFQLYGLRSCCARGTRNGLAKLDDDIVREVRKNRPVMTAKQWAQKLGVHLRTIEKVRARLTWTHV